MQLSGLDLSLEKGWSRDFFKDTATYFTLRDAKERTSSKRFYFTRIDEENVCWLKKQNIRREF